MTSYALMNKDKELLDMEMEKGLILSMSNVRKENIKFLPAQLIPSAGKDPSFIQLNSWWRTRHIPASRVNLKEILHRLRDQVSGIEELVEKSLGLSLSDHYWIRPDPAIKWEDVNFFTNGFSDDVGNLSLKGIIRPVYDLKNPGNTSDGVIIKRWRIKDGKRFLIKGSGSSLVPQSQPFRELFVSRLASVFLEGFDFPISPVVSYNLEMDEGIAYSVCENFVTKDTEYVPFHQIINSDGFEKEKSRSTFEHVESFYTSYKLLLHGMLLLDHIVLNEDRHFGNFGLMRCVNSGEFLYPAPLFDFGNSLFYNSLKPNPDTLYCKPFKDSFDDQLRLIGASRFSDNLHTIRQILDDLFEECFRDSFESKDRLNEILSIIHSRIDKIPMENVVTTSIPKE